MGFEKKDAVCFWGKRHLFLSHGRHRRNGRRNCRIHMAVVEKCLFQQSFDEPSDGQVEREIIGDSDMRRDDRRGAPLTQERVVGAFGAEVYSKSLAGKGKKSAIAAAPDVGLSCI